MKTLEGLRIGLAVCGDEDDDSLWKQKDPPPWFDQGKFDRGIAFFRRHMSSVLFSYMLSLIAGFNLDVFLQTLLFTGQSSSPEVSGKRYFATLLYILQWYDARLTDPESKGFKSLMRVRRIHHHVRLAMKKRERQILLDIVDHQRNDVGLLGGNNDEDAVATKSGNLEDDDENDFVYIDLQRPMDQADMEGGVRFRVTESYQSGSVSGQDVKDNRKSDGSVAMVESDTDTSAAVINDSDVEEEEKLYLNQYDMALVQVAFVAGVVLYPDWIGINDEKEAFEDYIFTWRVFGWYLGIHDRYNICEGNFEDVLAVATEVRDLELIPAIKKKSPEADAVTRAFIQGAHDKFKRKDASVSSFLSPAALISYSQRPFHLPKKYEPPDLTYFDEICLFALNIFFAITYYVPSFRNLVNSVLSLPNVMRLIA